MIKPVKRNKRLKWIDSSYAKFYRKDLCLDTMNRGKMILDELSGNLQLPPDIALENIAALSKRLDELPNVK